MTKRRRSSDADDEAVSFPAIDSVDPTMLVATYHRALMNRRAASRQHRLEAARLLGNTWLSAAILQKQRILDGEPGVDDPIFGDTAFRQYADFLLFLDAVRRVKRSALITLEVVKDEQLFQAIADFDEKTKWGCEVLRSMNEHHDDYLLGIGHQDGPDGPMHYSNLWRHSCEQSETDYVITQGGMRISTSEVLTAAEQLYLVTTAIRKAYFGKQQA